MQRPCRPVSGDSSSRTPASNSAVSSVLSSGDGRESSIAIQLANGPGDSIPALAGGRRARCRPLGASCQNGSHRISRRVTVSEKDGRRIKTKMAATQQSTNFYATNFEVGSVSPLFIHQLSRSRWRIDTAGMPPENARPFTSSQSDLLIGWSPLRPTPVNSTPLLVAMCPATLHGEYEPTPAPRYSPRPEGQYAMPPRSIFFIIPDRLQL